MLILALFIHTTLSSVKKIKYVTTVVLKNIVLILKRYFAIASEKKSLNLVHLSFELIKQCFFIRKASQTKKVKFRKEFMNLKAKGIQQVSNFT